MGHHEDVGDSGSISWSDAEEGIGTDGLKQIQELQRRLYPRENHAQARERDWQARVAPSITGRSELELFGTSMPRFAVRAYLDAERTSFVNARRVREFARRVVNTKWLPIPGGQLVYRDKTYHQDQSTDARPSDVILGNKCIGDSLLVPPATIRHDYHVLVAELGLAYGEGTVIRGTPFVIPIRCPGGGLCAQACCFMAAALLHDYPLPDAPESTPPSGKLVKGLCAGGVHGTGEVTAIVAGEDEPYLRLSGLNWHEIAEYFRRIGRAALSQRRNRIRVGAADEPLFFGIALRAFAMSGMPVILPVIWGRMRGPGAVYEDAQVGSDERSAEDHAIVLVGCGRNDENGFIINDPAGFPFHRTKLDGLLKCCPTSKSRYSPLLLAIAPAEVLLALETHYIKGTDPSQRVETPGLFDIAHLLQRAHPQWSGRPYPQIELGQPYTPGAFQLHRIATTPGRMSPDGLEPSDAQVIPDSDRKCEDLGLLWKRLSGRVGRWCWVQYRPENRGVEPASIWVWDAERERSPQCWWHGPEGSNLAILEDELPVSVFEAAESQLLAVFKKDKSHRWVLAHEHSEIGDGKDCETSASESSDSRTTEKRERRTDDKRRPNVSLISSFSPRGSSSSASEWPDVKLCNRCELYSFMHADPALDHCQPATDRMASIRAAALDAMAEIGRSLEIGGRSTIQARQRIKAVAERAAEPLNGKSVSITALASYLPEISSEYPRRAIYAVVFLVHLARALRAIRNEKNEQLNPVVVIELVAGTRVEGVARCIDPDDRLRRKHVYFARQRTRARGIKCLCNNLRSVVDKVRLRREETLALALELEPGPLFLLNDLPSMRMMAKELDRQKLSSIVGFNLDIAHFSLARVTPDELMKDKELLDRITHVHISDHGQGHFGDVIIGQSGLGRGGTVEGNFEPFHGWIKVIDQLSRRPEDPERPAFSGHVSLEMEASKREAVELSLERLNTLLSGV